MKRKKKITAILIDTGECFGNGMDVFYNDGTIKTYVMSENLYVPLKERILITKFLKKHKKKGILLGFDSPRRYVYHVESKVKRL